MALPKRRQSNSRSGKRRSHDAVKRPKWVICNKCESPKMPHAVCLVCGYKSAKRQSIKLELGGE